MSGARSGRDPAEGVFAGFLDRHWAEVVRFFRQGLYRERDRRNAEDCAQEAFIKLARRYRDDTATVRAVVGQGRATGRPLAIAELARHLACDPAEAEVRARRAVVSGWLRVSETEGGTAFDGAITFGSAPLVLDLAPLAAMRWTTYRNVLADYGRRRIAADNARAGDLADLVATGQEPRDPQPGPERATAATELHAQIAACLDTLPHAERTVLILHYFYGLRFPAIVTVPGVPELLEPPGIAEGRSATQLVQRLKDLAKAGRRQMRRHCPHLADFLVGGGDDDER